MITIRGGERYTHRVSSLIAGGVLTVLLAIALEPARGYAQGAPGPISADPNLKVAFIGDSGNGADFRRVLGLIKSACAVVRNVQRSYRAPPLPPIPRSEGLPPSGSARTCVFPRRMRSSNDLTSSMRRSVLCFS